MSAALMLACIIVGMGVGVEIASSIFSGMGCDGGEVSGWAVSYR